MNILFLVYHGFCEESGISKKIHYQVKGLRQNGHEVHLCYYDFDSRGHRCRYVDEKVITDYGTGIKAAIRSRFNLSCILDYCTSNGIEIVYVRSFMNASPVLIRLFKRLKEKGVRSVMEIPTYPYDSEFRGYPLKYKIPLYIDMLFRNSLSAQMEAIVTFSNEKRIFGQKAIRISNGIDFDALPLNNPVYQDEIHLIGVAEIHYWHGFDRLVAGMGEYYKKNPDGRKLYFHVVGGQDSRGMKANGYSTIEEVAKAYNIEKYVVMHGSLYGSQLNEVFGQCVFAVGSLGRHRSGITSIKTLKNREYATRGIPFIYSEIDSDFEDKPYVIKAPADESPIDIRSIIEFMDHFDMNPEDIRKTVEHLTWKRQMQKVIDELCKDTDDL